jgi:hypothetical protein
MGGGVAALERLDPGALTTQSIRASVIIADVDLRILHFEGPARPTHHLRRSLRKLAPARLSEGGERRFDFGMSESVFSIFASPSC